MSALVINAHGFFGHHKTETTSDSSSVKKPGFFARHFGHHKTETTSDSSNQGGNDQGQSNQGAMDGNSQNSMDGGNSGMDNDSSEQNSDSMVPFGTF